MARKMPKQLVALSSSAIAAIYLAGFMYTRGADASLATPATIGSVPATPAAASASAVTAATAPQAVVSATATPAVAPPAAVAATGYQDGTYTGTGTSRRGNVTVSVSVLSGAIANVTIANVTTQYPVSRIASLPGLVIAKQSAQIDNISGATYSAQAFQLAVQAALSKAAA